MVPVRDDGPDGIDNSTPDVGRDDKVLSLFGRVMESVLDDKRQECTETVKNGDDGNLADTVKPGLDVPKGKLDILPLVMAVAAAVGLGQLGTNGHDLLVLVVEEVGSLIILRDEENAHRSPDQGDKSFQNVEPPPAWIAGDPIHVQDSERNQSTESTRQG